MGIRFKLLLSFMASFVLIGAVSLYALQLRLHAEFEALEQTEVKAAVSRAIAVSENIPVSLLGLTIDWAHWSEMHEFTLHPRQLAAWADENIDAATVLNVDMSFIEVLGAQANVIRSSQSGKDGPHLSLDDAVRRLLVQRHAAGTAPPGCFFLRLTERFAAVCASNITPSSGNGNGRFAGVLATARVFSDTRMLEWQSKIGFPSRLISTADMPPHVSWAADEQTGPHIGVGKVALLIEADTQVIYLPLRGITDEPAVSLELRVPRAIHAQSKSLSQYVLAQTLITSFVTALLLALVVHWVLVRRLRSFHQQLSGMAGGGAWSRRLAVGGRDEIGLLASEVNGLLAVIETQVKELTVQSLTDPLTGLHNRRAFDMRLALEFARGRREDQMLALLLIDVDFFKRYNDRYGHPQGDEALKLVAHVLSTVSTRALDLAARIGGEEFVLMLPATSQEGAEQMANSIHQMLADKALPHADSAAGPCLTVSIGIALLGPDDESPSALLNRADKALYQAKTTGRNRFVFDRRL